MTNDAQLTNLQFQQYQDRQLLDHLLSGHHVLFARPMDARKGRSAVL